jgi:hypothetical protein
MGHFLAVTAIRAPVPEVSNVIVGYCGLHSLSCRELSVTQPDEKTDTLLFSEGGWTVVLWPEYFNVHDFPAARHLSEQCGTIASTVNVYDDDCWCHGLFQNGKLLDQFASAPDLIDVDPADWVGNADAVASALGVAPEDIAAYFHHIGPDLDLDAKAYPDDEFPLTDFWVFCDFWRRCSVSYPSDMSAFAACLRLGKNFADCLPFNE